MKAACYIEKLPTEVKLEIMGYLAGRDLARLACVSCEWRCLSPSSNSEVWKNLCHANEGWKFCRKIFRKHPKYNCNLGWNWKDMFGLSTLCGLVVYNWFLLHDCAEQGLHHAMMLFKEASKLAPKKLLYQPNYSLDEDQDPELAFFQYEWGGSYGGNFGTLEERQLLSCSILLSMRPPPQGQSHRLFYAPPPP